MELGRPGQLRPALHQPVLLERAAEHLHDRRALHRPAAAAGARPGAPAQLQAARPRRSSASRCSCPYATSVAAATLVFALLFGRDAGMINWAARPRRDRPGRLAERRLDGADRHLRDRHLALDRLQRADLPGRHAGDPARPVRGGRAGRRQPLAAVPARHPARAAADDPVHRRRLHDRRHPALRRAAAVRRRRRPTAARRTSTRRSACSCTSRAGSSGSSAGPPRSPG